MKNVIDIAEQLSNDARRADELHAASRALLVSAARAGAVAGLSQREIASAIGRSQPEVSRLLRFQGRSPAGRTLARNRTAVIRIAAGHGVRNIRVFGSVANGTDSLTSDIDLLADLPQGMSLFELARLENELANHLGRQVDVVPAGSLREHAAARVLGEAVPL
ncbi:MAG: nucleotidyltransferase domain-containing protein [Terrimesophilobacter sp.]